MRRFLAVLLLSVISFNCFAFAENTDEKLFPDVSGEGTREAVLKMYDKGYIKGYEDGNFKPEAEITRAELVRVFNQVFGYERKEKSDAIDFADVNSKQWYYNDVMIAKDNQYIFGFPDNTFKPKDNFTRQQVCVVLNSILGYQTLPKKVEVKDYVAPWANKYVTSVISNGVFNVDENGNFRATENITRGEVCVALSQFIYDEEEETNEKDTKVTVINDKKIKINSSSTVSSSGGGGGSSTTTTDGSTKTTTVSSNSDSNSATTTEATTSSKSDATTETTTRNSSKNTTTTEATTETTTEAITVDKSVIAAAKSVMNNLKNRVIPKLGSDAEKEVAQLIYDGINEYINDGELNSSTIESVKSKYGSLSDSEKDDLKYNITRYNYTSELLKLKDCFAFLL